MRIKKIILCIMLGLMFSDTNKIYNSVAAAANDGVCEELPIDLWIRPSNEDFGKLLYLDMSRGFSGSDGINIYLYVIDIITNEPIALVFPMNDYFEMDYSIFNTPPPSEPKKEEKEEEFDLEEYLKRTKGQGLEIKKVANSS